MTKTRLAKFVFGTVRARERRAGPRTRMLMLWGGMILLLCAVGLSLMIVNRSGAVRPLARERFGTQWDGMENAQWLTPRPPIFCSSLCQHPS
jgi:hypothetical protein